MRPTKAQMAALRRRDPVLGARIKHLPSFPNFPVGVLRGPYFHVLARSIVYQQLATRAAATIYGRVRKLGPGPRFPTPAQNLFCVSKSDNFSDFGTLKILVFQILAAPDHDLPMCTAPARPFIQGLASFEELVLRRQDELCGPPQHCTIRINTFHDSPDDLGAIEQL